MKISQKFQTPKGAVTIARVYNPIGIEGTCYVIGQTVVDAPFEDEAILDKFHRWAASAASENRLHWPPEEIIDLVGGGWKEISE